MSEETKELDYVIHNVHCHIFTIDYLPRNFIGWYFPTTLASKKWVAKRLLKLARRFAPRFAGFIYSAKMENQKSVFKELIGYYPKQTKFCPLTVDFDYMNAGKAKKDYLQQLKDVAQLKENEKYKDKILPFVCADPRRENILDLIKEYIEDHKFTGIKLYPALGFFPDDKRLDGVYEYAEANEIPITTHCIPKNKNHFRYRPTKEMIDIARTRFEKFYNEKDGRKAYDFAKYLNHPTNYEYVLKKFPKLKINLAHFGGNEEWDKYLDVSDENFKDERNWYSLIRKLIANKDHNVYSDISFTVHDDKLYPLLKNLTKSRGVKDRVLFGSDFYMLQKDYHERRFGLDVRGYLSDDEYWLIAETNPKEFLNLP